MIRVITTLLNVAVILCELNTDTKSESDVPLCVTTTNGVQCGDGSDVKLTRIDGHEIGYKQRIDTNDTQESVVLTTLSTKPFVYEIENFLSSEECDYFKNLAVEAGLKESVTTLQGHSHHRFVLRDNNNDRKLTLDEMRQTIEGSFDTYLDNEDIQEMYKTTGWDSNGDEILTPEEVRSFSPKDLEKYITDFLKVQPEKHSRMSKQVWLYPDKSKDKVFSRIQKRVAKVVSLPIELIKLSDFQVVSYGIKGHYNAHWDSSKLNNHVPCCTRERMQSCRICRYMTILFYLSEVEEGGETAFPIANNSTLDLQILQDKELVNLYKKCQDSNLRVAPSKGKAIIWYNHFINEDSGWLGELDEYTFHGGCPVTKGTKWIANFWVKTTDDKFRDLKKMQKFFKRKKSKRPKMPKQEL